jgi:hypothetical protein
MAEIDLYKRGLLEAMGETKVRMALEQGVLVWHLHEPALAWLGELNDAKAAKAKEKQGAADQGEKRSDDLGEHQGDDRRGSSAEAGGSGGIPDGGEG